MKIMLFALASASLLSLSGGAPRATNARLTSIEVLTPRLDPLDGAVARLDNGIEQVVVVAGVDGQAPWMAFDPSAGFELTLAERTFPAGVALGMIEQVPAQSAPLLGEYLQTRVSRTQPLAVPLLIQGLSEQVSNLFPPPGDYPHWTIAVPSSGTPRFTAHLAPLLDEEAIEQYLSYRGHSAGTAYVRGLVMVVPGVQLGASGILVGIRLLGDLADGVAVDGFNFTSTPHLAPAGDPLRVRLVDVVNDRVYLHVTGGIRKGQLALLLRPPSDEPDQVWVLRDQPPTITMPLSAPPGIDYASTDCGGCGPRTDAGAATSMRSEEALPVVTNCEPPVPNPGDDWACDAPPPPSSECGPAVVGSRECKVVRSRTPRWCRSPGSTVEGTRIETAKWKVSFQLTGAHGEPLSSAGGFEYGKESTSVLTDTWTALPGAHGLGQCMRYFRFNLVCLQTFLSLGDVVLRFEDRVEVLPCAYAHPVSVVCEDVDDSQSVCDRTP